MRIGIIGGSGLEKANIFSNMEETDVYTPYGIPSSRIKKCTIGKDEIYIISRHGFNHEITPTNVNNKANIYALKKLGCKYILATTAVGSLKESIIPGDFVIANQFIDFTKHRETTFFDDFKDGVKHTSLADPFSENLRNFLIESCGELSLSHHKIGTILTIEGPRFSTRAESFMFKNFAHVINMSTAPEAILAKEAGMEYAVVAMVTDYDCWKKSEKPVSWEEVEKVMKQNSEKVTKLLVRTIEKISNYNKTNEELELIKKSIRTIPNFPKEGIMFRDITTLMKDPISMGKTINIFYERYKDKKIDVVAGIESRGFIFGAILASKLNCAFVPIRKKGKLPSETISEDYDLEYGKDTIEIHKDSIKPGQRVLIVDDLIATGGTAQASAKLVEKIGGEIFELAFIIELPELRGKDKLINWPVFSLVEFEGE